MDRRPHRARPGRATVNSPDARVVRFIRPQLVGLAALLIVALIAPAAAQAASSEVKPAAYRKGALVFALAGIPPLEISGATLRPGGRELAVGRLREAALRGV